MKWLHVASAAVSELINRIPVEKLIFKAPDNKKRLEELQDILTPLEPSTADRQESASGEERQKAHLKSKESSISLPSTEETTRHLRDRLQRFLSDFEDDLVDGGRIAGKPCDCLEKHSSKIRGVCLELSSMDEQPLYTDIINWLDAHEDIFSLSQVNNNSPDIYRHMTPEIRRYRKLISGTEPIPQLEGRSARMQRFAETKGLPIISDSEVQSGPTQ